EFLRAVSGWAEAYEGDINEATESTKRLIGAAGEGSKELQKAMAANRKVIDGLAQSLYEAGLSGEALAVAKARASLNEFATPAEVQQVEDLARAIQRAQEITALAQKVGDKPREYVFGEVAPLSGGQFDEQAARYQAEAQAEEERYTAQLERLREALEAQKVTYQEYCSIFEDLQRTHADRMEQIDQARNMVLLKSGEEGFAALADTMRQAKGEQSALYKAMFAASKAFAIAQS